MNSYQIIVLCLAIALCSSTSVNTTDFWQRTLGATSIGYQCYSGTILSMQATKKSIGTTPKDSLACTTVCFLRHRKVSSFLINKYRLSSGFREDLEVAPSSALSLSLDLFV